MKPSHDASPRSDVAKRAIPPNLCFVGFGEVTRQWLRTLIEAGYPRGALQVLYLNRESRASPAIARAADLGVALALTPAAMGTHADLFVHATTPAAAVSVFEACMPALRPGDLWVDVNSSSQSSKKTMAARAATIGVEFVDAAMMAPASLHGHRAPLWLSGAGIERFAEWAETWGTPIVELGPEAGTSARVKMCRSVIIKGIAAALVEGMMLAEMNGVTDSVLKSIREDLGAETVDLLCRRFIAGTLRHGERRAGEMSGSLELAEESHWPAKTISSTAALLHYVATSGGTELAARSSDYRQLLTDLASRIRSAPQP